MERGATPNQWVALLKGENLMTSTTELRIADTRIPMIQTGQALLSLRDSGHSLPTALGEVIDNSIEAKANNIRIRLHEDDTKGRKKRVHQIAIADDGTGMSEAILHRYLVIGFSTRYMSTSTMGKYGVGAKLAALNFARRIDVWSREKSSDSWLHVYLDLDEAIEEEKLGQTAGIAPPSTHPVPPDLTDLLTESTGTLVVWSKVDRLEEGRLAPNFDELRLEVEKELSRIFRYFINGGIKISVNDKPLLAHDPLFLMESTWADRALIDHYAKANSGGDRTQASIQHYEPTLIADELIQVTSGFDTARLRVTLYPKEVLRKRGLGNDKLAKELRVPENEGRISFVRLDREISYTSVPRIFATRVEDPDRFIGIEVSFKPTLDEYFGVRNVKRGVEPHGELRDKIRARLQAHIKTARSFIQEAWGKAAKDERDNDGEHTAINQAVKDANLTMPKGRAEVLNDENEVKQILDDLAQDVVGDDEEEKAKYLENIKDFPIVLESVDFPGNMFIDVKHLADKVIIRLNTRHRFYREMWEPLKDIADRDAGTVSSEEAIKAARRSIEALSLLIDAYGKAQSMHPTPNDQYDDLTIYWGQFLNTLMSKVKDVI